VSGWTTSDGDTMSKGERCPPAGGKWSGATLPSPDGETAAGARAIRRLVEIGLKVKGGKR
jgi:hypothetical protein